MGRAGYMGCLVVMGVLLMAVACLAVFGATGAITAERGPSVAQASSSQRPSSARATAEPTGAPREAGVGNKPETGAGSQPDAAPEAAEKPRGAATSPAKPIPVGTVPPKAAAAGPEGSIAQRLDREVSGGGLKL